MSESTDTQPHVSSPEQIVFQDTLVHFQVLQSLGMVGWNHLEAPIIASLVMETPLLLIGDHGTAKSMVLERLADALGVSFRHYNASILNFDDLIGFPAPDDQRQSIRYLRSGMDAWDAEAIFVDEISRCRPDMQNRLFPLIYDRKLQGLSLDKLKFRWSAMNPPPSEEDPNRYFGSFELDDAFADRYDWIVKVPSKLSSHERRQIIHGTDIQSDASERLLQAMAYTRSRLNLTREVYGDNLTLFFDSLFTVLKRQELPISFRRLRMLFDNAIALIATGYYATPMDAIYRTVLNGLPHRASQRISAKKIQQIVSTAMKVQSIPIESVRRQLLEEHDPINRILIALPTRDDNLVTATVLDSYATISPPNRMALSAKLFPTLIEYFPNVSALVLSQISDDVSKLHSLSREERRVYTNSVEYETVQQILTSTVQLTPEQVWIEDVLWVCFRESLIGTPKEVRTLKIFSTSLHHKLERWKDSIVPKESA